VTFLRNRVFWIDHDGIETPLGMAAASRASSARPMNSVSSVCSRPFPNRPARLPFHPGRWPRRESSGCRGSRKGSLGNAWEFSSRTAMPFRLDYVLLGLAAVIAVWLALVFNRSIALRNKVREAWSGIDVQLKRRHDLVPALVETVKGYQKHEAETLAKVVASRNAAVQAHGVAEAGAAKTGLSAQVHALLRSPKPTRNSRRTPTSGNSAPNSSKSRIISNTPGAITTARSAISTTSSRAFRTISPRGCFTSARKRFRGRGRRRTPSPQRETRMKTPLQVILVTLCAVVSALAQEERIVSFHSDIVIDRSGSLTIEETIRVIAQRNKIQRGIYRDFPTLYQGYRRTPPDGAVRCPP